MKQEEKASLDTGRLGGAQVCCTGETAARAGTHSEQRRGETSSSTSSRRGARAGLLIVMLLCYVLKLKLKIELFAHFFQCSNNGKETITE